MMKKILLLVFAAFLAPSVWGYTMQDPDDPVLIPMETLEGETGGSRSPSIIPIVASYSAALSSICVCYSWNLGSVTVEIENQTTGEYAQTLVNAMVGSTAFLISGTAGHWTITFTLFGGTKYVGEFDIY